MMTVHPTPACWSHASPDGRPSSQISHMSSSHHTPTVIHDYGCARRGAAHSRAALIVLHRLQVLIFSQMTKMLDLLHYYLEERGFDPCRIDGSIPWEERMVRRCFNKPCHHQPQRKRPGMGCFPASSHGACWES